LLLKAAADSSLLLTNLQGAPFTELRDGNNGNVDDVLGTNFRLAMAAHIPCIATAYHHSPPRPR